MDVVHEDSDLLKHVGEISRHAVQDVRQSQQDYAESDERLDRLAFVVDVESGRYFGDHAEADIDQKQREQGRSRELHCDAYAVPRVMSHLLHSRQGTVSELGKSRMGTL